MIGGWKFDIEVLNGPFDVFLLLARPVSFLFFWFLVNPYNSDFSSSQVLVNTYALNIFVGWTFFSAFLLLRSDEEWKAVDAAVKLKDFKTFMIEATKKIAITVKVSYLTISVLVISSYYLFHYTSIILCFTIVFGMSFLVGLVTIVLEDIDDPLEGLVNVPNIPRDWMKKVKGHKQS